MTAHWGVPDPTAATGTEAEIRSAFDNCFRMLAHRIYIFMNLPLRSLDAVSLQRQLNIIGRIEDAGAAPASVS
jgi:arsenate reductase